MFRPFHFSGSVQHQPSERRPSISSSSTLISTSTSPVVDTGSGPGRQRRATSISSPLSASYTSLAPASSSSPDIATERATAGHTGKAGLNTTARSSLIAATSTTTSSYRSRSVQPDRRRTPMGTPTGPYGTINKDPARPGPGLGLVQTHGAGTHFVCQDAQGIGGPSDALSEYDEIEPESVRFVRSADELLLRGIGDYTFRPGEEGVVGKGKFSTVYKVRGIKGEIYALKHTPLYPHHPLISARLLREPTLLAQLPPHPCLIGVQGYIKTPDHIYLVEQLSRSHSPLSAVPMPIEVGLAGKVLDQLVSVVRDGLHEGGRVCHRDLKADNLLIDETGHILLLDLGLATHFSLSKPRLTTCCGSPAYYSPEIVDALQNPPGTRTYYGPELDIWCIGLTLLALSTGRKYPIGTSHKSPAIMAQGVKECLMEADKVITDRSYERTGSDLNDDDWDEWMYVKTAIEGFMKIDGDTRMRNFAEYRVGRFWEDEAAMSTPVKDFKTISFEKTDVKHPLPIFLTDRAPDDEPNDKLLWMCNPERVGIKNVISYIKYLMRTDGILYHCMAFSEGTAVIQCVLPLSPDSPLIEKSTGTAETWSLSGLFARRAVSQPGKARSTSRSRAEIEARRDEQDKKLPCLRFWMRIRCSDREDPAASNSASSPVRENALGVQGVPIAHTASPLRMTIALPTPEEPARDEANHTPVSPPQVQSLQNKKPSLRLLNIKSPPLAFLTKETCYPCQWPASTADDTPSIPGTPGAPNPGCPWVQIEISDVRAREALQKALSQERWQSLGLEPLTLGSRPNSRAASRVRNWAGAGSRQVSQDSSRVSSPLVTPMLELSEEDLVSLARGRGRKGNDKLGTLEIKHPARTNPSQMRHDVAAIARRSRSALPSPPNGS